MSKQFWKWQNSVDSNGQELVIDGIISDESWFGDEVTPKELRDELASHTGDLVVSINSPGGDVFAGVSMYNELSRYEGNVTVRVDGLAASIASVIAMAGDKIIMSPGSMMMIHKPWTFAIGNSDDIDKVREALNKIEDTIVPIYTTRTGKTKDEIQELLTAETWFTPEDAVAEGFADEAVEAKKSSYSDAFKNLFSNQMAYSMSAIKPVMDDMIEKIKAEDAEEVEDVSTPKPKEDVADEATETTDESKSTKVEEETKEESEKVTDESKSKANKAKESKTEEETESEEDKQLETVNNKEKKDMPKSNKTDEQAAIEVVAKATPKHKVKDESVTKSEARKMIVKSFAAVMAKDDKKLAEINDKLKTMKVRNEVDGTSGEPLFAPEILANDIRAEYDLVGRIGALVDRVDIEGAETYRQVVRTAGTGFTPVALGAEKDEDQPVWDSVVFEPFEWALIVVWLDGVASRSPLAVYQDIVSYIAREVARLEDKIVLTYEGGTVGSETRPASGLVPILTTASRTEAVSDYTSANVVPALGKAYGEVESDESLTVVANRRTWAKLATSLDGENRPIFTVVGEQVMAGALGTFNVVQSNVLEDGDVVIGAFRDYKIVTRGTLGTLLSREATVGDVNLFTQDATALRADLDITGKPVFTKSFYLLQFATS